jgi:hypothetical protein
MKDHHSESNQKYKKELEKCLKISVITFGHFKQRFDAGKTLTPGPGTYNDTRIAFSSLGKIHGIKNTPFAQSALRFDPEFKAKSAPGPGQYKLMGFAEENLRRAIMEARRKPAFGQSAPRKFNLAKKDEHAMPGPAQYQVKEKTFKPKYDNMCSNFASTTKREPILNEV